MIINNENFTKTSIKFLSDFSIGYALTTLLFWAILIGVSSFGVYLMWDISLYATFINWHTFRLISVISIFGGLLFLLYKEVKP